MVPDSAEHAMGAYRKWVRRATEALGTGNLSLATQYLGLLAQTHPHDAEYLRLQAVAYDAGGRIQDAIGTMRQAMALNANSAACCDTMARLLDHAYEYDAAIWYAERAVQLDPNFFTGWYNLSIVLSHVGAYEEAVSALRRAKQLSPGNPLVRTRLAELLRDNGLVSDAENAYREILRERPTTGSAWIGLADLKTFRFSPADVEAMRLASTSPYASSDDRVAIDYSLARAYEDAGQYADSLKALQAGKASLLKRQPWDAAGFSRRMDAIVGAFTPSPVRKPEVGLGREVIFIVGLPRSGTTLVEQILASHSEVEGGGEITDLASVLSEESARRGSVFPVWVPVMSAADWGRLGQRYLDRTVRRRRQHPVHTDKLPSNWVFIGAIMEMLPAARVVCCRRDPVETCFSNYRQYRSRVEYTGSFSDLASFWMDYDKSVKYWCNQYPNNVFEHSYENLLSEPKSSISGLVSNCGLPWDDHCLEFWRTQRDVHTPSAAQVRLPLFVDASRAQCYGHLLDPLRRCLGRTSETHALRE